VRGANVLDDYLEIDQSSTASGVTRGGRTYEVSLTKPLKYKRFCGIAVEGIKRYVLDAAKVVTIDYGAGTCDRNIVVTVDGVERTFNVD
jgi:hypothetical protein